jgi:hypothetical protein
VHRSRDEHVGWKQAGIVMIAGKNLTDARSFGTIIKKTYLEEG